MLSLMINFECRDNKKSLKVKPVMIIVNDIKLGSETDKNYCVCHSENEIGSYNWLFLINRLPSECFP